MFLSSFPQLMLLLPHCTGAKRESPKCGLLKCREEHPKLLGSKFQERYFVIRDQKLLLLKEKRVKLIPAAQALANAHPAASLPPGQW